MKCSYNQNRCHSFSHDSLDKEFIENTKQKCKDFFHQTNFNQFLHQIQTTLQPVAEQLRQEIQKKKSLSKRERFVCLKSCAKFITETLINDKYDDFIYQPNEFIRLQQTLNCCSMKSTTNVFTQTEPALDFDLRKLRIDDSQKEKKPTIHSTDQLTRQRTIHRSMSRTFRKLNHDLQKLNHEIPFQSHLAKYHRHNYHEK